MTFNFNVFRILGDVSHTASKCILIWAIHSNRSAEGVSLLTQVLYCFVFCTRYLDLFWSHPFADWTHAWNFFLKIFYISSSFYIVFLMMRVYARTREREKAWKLGIWSLVGSAIGAPLVYLIFRSVYKRFNAFPEILWTFSEILESVAVLPQLLLLRETTVPTVIDSFYLVTLGSYRAFYILNWIVRGAVEPGYKDPTSWTFGIIQTALYLDFAWVYWTRQRVKLRQGGVVDSDDLSRGWLVGRILGRKSGDFDEEEAPAVGGRNGAARRGPGRWGARGISVSADEDVHDARKKRGQGEESEPLTDPNAFEDDLDDDDEDIPAAAPSKAAKADKKKSTSDDSDDGHESGVSGGAEWRDDHQGR